MDISLFNQNGNLSPARGFLNVTPSDSANLTSPIRALFVGGAGNAVVVMVDNVFGTSTGTFTGLVAGMLYPIQAVQIRATGTTATGLVGLQ